MIRLTFAVALCLAAGSAGLMPSTSAASARACGKVRVSSNPSYAMRVTVLSGNVTCATAKRIIRASLDPGPLAGFSCDSSPGERPSRINCHGKSVVDGRSGKFRGRRV
jgi:hypothetical protein